MQLVYVERTFADDDDKRLQLILQARAKAAERCVEANQHATDIRRDLITHIARRLVAGAQGSALRKAMMDAGINPTMASDIMQAASHPDAFSLRDDPRQKPLPYG